MRREGKRSGVSESELWPLVLWFVLRTHLSPLPPACTFIPLLSLFPVGKSEERKKNFIETLGTEALRASKKNNKGVKFKFCNIFLASYLNAA